MVHRNVHLTAYQVEGLETERDWRVLLLDKTEGKPHHLEGSLFLKQTFWDNFSKSFKKYQKKTSALTKGGENQQKEDKTFLLCKETS